MKTQVSTLTTVGRSAERQSTVAYSSLRRPQVAPLRIIVVDDHPITLEGLNSLLSGERDFCVVASYVDAHEAVRAVRTHKPDVVVIDQEMPKLGGVEILRQLRASGDQTRVVLLANANNPKLIEALTLNVDGIVFKHADPKHLVRCLREVRVGRRWLDASLNTANAVEEPGEVLDALTRRQIEVARAAVSGLSNKELAQKLGVSEGTIKNHLHAIYERLQIEGRLALLLYLKEKALA